MTIRELLLKSRTCCCHHPEHERLLINLAGVVEHLQTVIQYAEQEVATLTDGVVGLPALRWQAIVKAAEVSK